MKQAGGRPPYLYTCNRCGKVLGAAAVRSHKCETGYSVEGQTKCLNCGKPIAQSKVISPGTWYHSDGRASLVCYPEKIDSPYADSTKEIA